MTGMKTSYYPQHFGMSESYVERHHCLASFPLTESWFRAKSFSSISAALGMTLFPEKLEIGHLFGFLVFDVTFTSRVPANQTATIVVGRDDTILPVAPMDGVVTKEVADYHPSSIKRLTGVRSVSTRVLTLTVHHGIYGLSLPSNPHGRKGRCRFQKLHPKSLPDLPATYDDDPTLPPLPR